MSSQNKHETGYLKVDPVHQVYYESHGNPDGQTILFIHGGPGIGTKQSDLEFFNLDKLNVILFDQRACGKSTPKGELKNNTTNELLEDISKLLIHLEIDKVILFGGSWGSALSLLFGIRYPEKVKGMILRGLFTATKEERAYFESGGVKKVFPDVWQRFESQVPLEFKTDVSKYYFDQILNATTEVRDRLAFELCYYGYSVSSQNMNREKIKEAIEQTDYITRAKILSHYSINDFFIEDNFIENNIDALSEIPIKIVHGKDDHITLPRFAIKIAEHRRNIQLTLVEGGHSPHEERIKNKLIESVDKMTESTVL